MTSSTSLVQAYAGDYIDLVEEELTSSKPDAELIIRSFLQILDGLTTMLTRETTVIHQDRDSRCQCSDYIMNQCHDMVELEDRIQAFLKHEITTDPNACWLTRITHKYRLLFHVIERGASLELHETAQHWQDGRGRYMSAVEELKARERRITHNLALP